MSLKPFRRASLLDKIEALEIKKAEEKPKAETKVAKKETKKDK